MARKKEELEHTKSKIQALKEEHNGRRSEVDALRTAKQREERGKQNKKSFKKEEAFCEFAKKEVEKYLKEKIPTLSDIPELDDAAGGGGKSHKSGPSEISLHDTVRVNYDDFVVTYRIDAETTVEGLLRDASAYWGLCDVDYNLCRVDGNLKLHRLEDIAAKVQEPGILDPQEISQLRLILKTETLPDVEEESEGEAPAIEEVVTGKKKEHWKEAFKIWPGMYKLVSGADRPYPSHRHTYFRNFAAYFLLVALSALCLNYRCNPQYYWVRQGAVELLDTGIRDEFTSQRTVPFSKIFRQSEVWDWLGGSFHYQIFNPSSTLRQSYEPTGYMRVRHQRAKTTTCIRDEIPDDMKPCYSVSCYGDLQEKDQIIYDDVWFNETYGGRVMPPYPDIWASGSEYGHNIPGKAQRYYDGAGYSIVYNVTLDMLNTTGDTFLEDLDIFREYWFDISARMLNVEMVLANYAMGSYLDMSFLIEVTPSGAVIPSAQIVPFALANGDGDNKAAVIDYVRWFLVFGYILVFVVPDEFRKKYSQKRTGFSYIFSITGFADMSAIALACAITDIRLRVYDPPNPATLTQFYRYDHDARMYESLLFAEGLFLFFVLVKVCFLMAMLPNVYLYLKMYSESIHMIAHFCMFFAPIFGGCLFLAHSIWSTQVYIFSTWQNTFVSLSVSVSQDFDVELLEEKGGVWTFIFIFYFFIVSSAFFLNGFFAIYAYTYFQMNLLKGADPGRWVKNQYLDYLLHGKILKKFFNQEPGACTKTADQLEDGEEEEEEDESDDDKDD